MSDFEATGSRAPTAAPITTVAAGKLRAISANQPRFAHPEGLIDAFAEVFARMAESSRGPTESSLPPAEIKDELAEVDQPIAHSDTAAESGSQPDPTPAEPVDLGRPGAEVKRNDVADEAGLVERPVRVDEPRDVEVHREVQASEEIVVADVTLKQQDTAEAPLDTPKVVAPEEIPSDGSEPSRRRRRDAVPTKPVENAEAGHHNHDRSLPNQQHNALGDQTGGDQQRLVNEGVEQDQTDATRHRRGQPRYTRPTTDNQPPPVSQTNRSGAQHQTPQVAGVASGSQPLATRSGQAESAPSRVTAKTIESQIANVQAAQASANRSGPSARLQSGARGINQTLETTSTSRNAAGTRPSSSRPGSNTRETVSRIRLIQRVSKAFQHLGPEGGVVRLRLAPAEMGSVRVEMRIQQRKVQARVVAETEAAGTALREHLPDLRARLESFGMQVDKIDVETDSHEFGQQSHWSDESHGDSRQKGHGQNGRRLDRPEAEAGESVSPIVSQATPLSPPHAVSGSVDVRL